MTSTKNRLDTGSPIQVLAIEGPQHYRSETKRGVSNVTFQTRPQSALAEIHAGLEAGVPFAPVLADARYGVVTDFTDFRDGITTLRLCYIVGIQSSASLWPPGKFQTATTISRKLAARRAIALRPGVLAKTGAVQITIRTAVASGSGLGTGGPGRDHRPCCSSGRCPNNYSCARCESRQMHLPWSGQTAVHAENNSSRHIDPPTRRDRDRMRHRLGADLCRS
jgi:hypothetical protein